jgi:hypothetical protein
MREVSMNSLSIKGMLDRLSRKRLQSKIADNGFWFIDIPRTSSSSIRTELATNFGPLYGKTNLLDQRLRSSTQAERSPLLRLGIGDHATAVNVRSVISKTIWNKIYTFALVRNPWDRMLSLYFYRLKRGHLPANMLFRDYILQLRTPQYGLRKSMHSKPAYYYSASEYLCDDLGEPIVDFIGKYEQRNEFVEVIAAKLMLPEFGTLTTQQAKPQASHYSEFYDSETELLVGNAHARDIDLFGYRFQRKPGL